MTAQPFVADLAALLADHNGTGYREFLRVPALSLGLFTAQPGYDDIQEPHQQDEVYVVLGGRAVLDIDGTPTPVQPGTIAYVPRRITHRFTNVSEDLRVLVMFAPLPPL